MQLAMATAEWPTSRPLRIRVAVHTGPAELRAGDYYGSTVNRCARLRGIGHGGQTIVSHRTQVDVDACSKACYRLLRDCPGVRILATSREDLRLDGEVTIDVGPLHVAVTEKCEAPTVQLFVERARAANRRLAVDDHTSDIRRICSLLDGLPLAIELAAARARSLAIPTIAEQLERTLDVLGSKSAALEPHHRTLEASIQWSYDQLSPAERALLCRLAVFPGGMPRYRASSKASFAS